MSDEPSDRFLEQFGGCGAPTLDCQCGRRHHAPDSTNVGEREADEMRLEAKAHPDKVFLEHDVDSIYAKQVAGISMVVGCPCNTLGKLERVIWEERAAIVAYYQQRRAADAEALSKLDDVLKGAPQ